MKLLDSFIDIDTKTNTTNITMRAIIFTKKYIIKRSMKSGDLAHCRWMDNYYGLTMADKFLSLSIEKFNNKSIFE